MGFYQKRKWRYNMLFLKCLTANNNNQVIVNLRHLKAMEEEDVNQVKVYMQDATVRVKKDSIKLIEVSSVEDKGLAFLSEEDMEIE